MLDAIVRISPHYERPDHLSQVADAFEEARRGKRVRCLIFAPPRHGKTELFLHAIPWWFQRDEHKRDTFGYVSYGSEFAEGKSRFARDYAMTNGWVPHPKFDTMSEWRNRFGGGVLARGIDGPLVGQGLNVLLCDDPHKNRQEAESPHMRGVVFDWFKGTARQRMEPGGSIFVSHQRWHDDDLIGRLKKEGGWDSIELPALSPDNEPLWPSRWPLEELADLARSNEYNWMSQYMGSPIPKAGKLFKEDPARYSEHQDGVLILTCDPAGSAKTTANYWALCAQVVSGYSGSMVSDIIEVERFQLRAKDAAPKLIDFTERHGHAPIHIEATRDGVEAAEEIIRLTGGRVRIVLFPARGDKLLRAQTPATAWNQGRVRCPFHAPWLADFLTETTNFTGLPGGVDDQTDAFVHGFNIGFDRKPMVEATPPPRVILPTNFQDTSRGF